MIFDPKDKDKLDNPERRKILPPEDILIKSGLKEGHLIADIGCGIGYFSIPASKIVGSKGKVFACDISSEMLDELRNRIVANGITNIELIQNKSTSLPLEDNFVDFVLISNVLHEVENKSKFLAELRRILKYGGRLILIDWLDKETEDGPPLSERLSSTEIETLLHMANFVIHFKETISDKFHYYLAEKV